MSDYTPTTDEIRTGYAAIGDAIIPEHEEEFDRWLAAHDAEVREAAAQSIIDNVSHAENCRQEPDPYWACDCGVSLCVAFARTDNPFAAHGESEQA